MFMLKQLFYNALQYMKCRPILVEMENISTSDEGPSEVELKKNSVVAQVKVPKQRTVAVWTVHVPDSVDKQELKDQLQNPEKTEASDIQKGKVQVPTQNSLGVWTIFSPKSPEVEVEHYSRGSYS